MTELASQELEDFLEFIYGDQSGYSYIALRPTSTDQWNTYFFNWPNDKIILTSFIRTNTKANEVYYSPALFSKPSGKREDFKTSQVVWCEFDGELPDNLDNVPPVSLKIQSSTAAHEHWYWRLNSPISSSKALEAITVKIAYRLNADHCWNSNRVLRPVETTHHESRQQVKIFYQNNAKATVADFISLPDVPEYILSPTLGVIPKVLDVVAKYKWEPEPWALFMASDVKEGSRSSALTKIALNALEMGMSNSETMAILYSADDRVKKFKDRTDRKERLLSLLKYALNKIAKDSKTLKKTVLESFSFREFFEQDVVMEWVLPGILAKQGSAIIAGPPEVGKTQVSLQTAIHLGLGKEFLGWKPDRCWKTVILSLEMNHAHLMYFLKAMRKDLSVEEMDILHENLIIVPLGEPLDLGKPQDQEKLNEVMDRYRPEGLITDSLGLAMHGLNSDEDVNNTFGYINGIVRNKFRAFNWFVHFPRKGQVGNRRPKSLDDLYGNRYIGGQIDLGLLLWPTGDSIELSQIKNRLGSPFVPKMIKRTANLNFTLSTVGLDKSNSQPSTGIMDF